MLHTFGPAALSGMNGFLYLDPGSGSVLLQVLIAVILGLGIAIRTQWTRIKSLFSSEKKSESDTEHDE